MYILHLVLKTVLNQQFNIFQAFQKRELFYRLVSEVLGVFRTVFWICRFLAWNMLFPYVVMCSICFAITLCVLQLIDSIAKTFIGTNAYMAVCANLFWTITCFLWIVVLLHCILMCAIKHLTCICHFLLISSQLFTTCVLVQHVDRKLSAVGI